LEFKDPNVKPFHAKPYPVPYSQEKQLKDEIKRLCSYGVLRKINNAEWACPMFTIAKPDGSLDLSTMLERLAMACSLISYGRQTIVWIAIDLSAHNLT
jgi:hypothetical protein